MTSYAMPPHDGAAILNFLGKRGESSAAFFLPFLHDEMTLLDIGCGPGSVTVVLAEKVRRAIGIDIQSTALETARAAAKKTTSAALEFIRGDMASLPISDSTIDAIFAHAVLYHLDATTLAKTFSEARRVLRPGGLIGIRDVDTGGDILHPNSEALSRALNLWTRWYRHEDQSAAQFGRRQGEVLRANGFTPIWSGASYENYSRDAATRLGTVADATHALQEIRQELIDEALATDSEIEEALGAWIEWGSKPDARYLRCRCECVARKDA